MDITKKIDYIICSIERSGSTLLRHYLHCARAGDPHEWRVPNEKAEYKLNNTYEIVGLTLFRWRMDDFLKSIHPAAIKNAKYIWLKRVDKTRHTISLLKAIQTGAYISTTPEARSPEYKEWALEKLCAKLCHIDSLWLEYFKKNEITPYVITYEELDELPYETLCDVLTFLEQPPVSRNEFDAIYADIPFERQANMTTVEWLERWRVSSSKEGWKP